MSHGHAPLNFIGQQITSLISWRSKIANVTRNKKSFIFCFRYFVLHTLLFFCFQFLPFYCFFYFHSLFTSFTSFTYLYFIIMTSFTSSFFAHNNNITSCIFSAKYL